VDLQGLRPEDAPQLQELVAGAVAHLRVFLAAGALLWELEHAADAGDVINAMTAGEEPPPSARVLDHGVEPLPVAIDATAFLHTEPDAVRASLAGGGGLVVGLDVHGNAGPLLLAGADAVISEPTALEIDADGAWKLHGV
jgi:hypothetical protein